MIHKVVNFYRVSHFMVMRFCFSVNDLTARFTKYDTWSLRCFKYSDLLFVLVDVERLISRRRTVSLLIFMFGSGGRRVKLYRPKLLLHNEIFSLNSHIKAP